MQSPRGSPESLPESNIADSPSRGDLNDLIALKAERS